MKRGHSSVLTMGFAFVASLTTACSDDDDASSQEGAASQADASTSSADAGALRVKIESGEIEGAQLDTDVRAFLGIPYAKPPVGELRWTLPQKPEAWKELRATKEYGQRCAQPESTTLQNAASDTEDCLYLNVWAPPAAAKPPAAVTKKPVMVWIHGGGNVNGSTSEPLPYVKSGFFYSGEHLAEKDVVVVTMNYRLGVFGFLAHAGLADKDGHSGNQGLLDQQFALQWVKQNIEKFGGDPANVTIFGESAGSLDVCLHVASPKSRGLFHRAISESGGCTTSQTTAQVAETRSAELAQKLGCSGDDSLKCLRGKSTEELLTAATGSTFSVSVDGSFLPDQARALFDKGDIAKVPYILGSNTDEGTLFTTALSNITTDEAYRAVISQRVGEKAADAVMERYPVSKFKDEPKPYQAALARVFGDQTLVCSTYDSALRAAKAGAPTWMYNFDIPANMGGLGATHGSELVYVFGTSPNLSDPQKRASERIQAYWTNLAKQADPNGADLPKWPKFSAEQDVRLNLGLEFEVVEKFRTSECELWRSLYDASYNANK